MPPQSDDDRSPSFLGSAAVILLPIVCCGLPLLLASGALAGIGAGLGSPWIIGAAAALAICAVAWRARRRNTPSDSDEDCCPPPPAVRAAYESPRRFDEH